MMSGSMALRSGRTAGGEARRLSSLGHWWQVEGLRYPVPGSTSSWTLGRPVSSPALPPIQLCAEQRVAGISRAEGHEAGPGVLGRVTGEIRRGFSVTVVSAVAMRLLARLAHLGPGARAAAERRQLTLRLEERRRREREAYLMAHMGNSASRVGRAFVP